MTARKTALLIGASGLIGGHCLDFLLSGDDYGRVIALVRRFLPIDNPRLRQHTVDCNRLKDHFTGIAADDVYCCLGTTIKKAGSRQAFRKVDFAYPVETARLSLEKGATRFLLVSAIGADPGASIFYNRVKGEVEQAIDGLGFSGFSIFRPSLLLGTRKENRPAEALGQKILPHLSFVFKGPMQKYRPVEARAVAFAMAAAARKNRHGRQVFESHQIRAIWEQHAVEKWSRR